VVQSASEQYVLVVDGQDRIQKRSVELGEQTSARAEVVRGLSDNDRVVVGGQANYQIGELVKPRLENEPAHDQTGEQP